MPHLQMEFVVSHTAPDAPSLSATKHQIVRAGAGAGKTYTLTHKVMAIAEEMYASEKRWPRIVVTTFTRKATQELRERLMLLALEEKPHLVDFINSRSHLMVSTIHGVMDLFLKRYGSHLDLDPGYTVVSGSQAIKLARQVLREVILDVETSDKADADLLETLPFNTLTKLMRSLDATYAEDPDAAPYSLDDFETMFQKRALEVARELESVAFNVREESTQAGWLKMAEDYVSLANILKRPGWTTNRAEYETLFTNIKSGRWNAKNPPVTPMTNDDAKAVRVRAKSLLDPVFDPQAWAEFSRQYALIDTIARRFSERFRHVKRRSGYLELSDLELLAMEAVRTSPEAAQAFSTEWDHWLIDEYQDTSPFQVKLLKSLTGDQPNFVVGDPQQSIYLFRGARSEVFGQRQDEITSAGGELKLLPVNRRSHPELLLFLNDFFARFEPPFTRMEPFLEGRTLEPSKVVAEVFIAPALTAGDDEDGDESSSDYEPEPDSDSGPSTDDMIPPADVEMKALVARVQTLVEHGAKPDEICVLARKNQTLVTVAGWLSKHGLPTHVHSAAGFFERRETRDALAFLKFLINPQDTFNTVEVLRSPCFKVSDQLMSEIMASLDPGTGRRPESLWQALIAPSAKTLVAQASDKETLLKLQDHIANVSVMGLTGAFRQGLIASGFVDVSHIHDSSGRRESNVWKLLARLESEEARPGFNPLSFVSGTVAELKLEDGNGEGDAVAAVEPNRINLMTIHSSKGLEFKHVILPSMNQPPKLTTSKDFIFDPVAKKWAARIPFGDDAKMTKSLPEILWVEDFKKQELAEHARLLYVALTRAVETVFLSWSEPVRTNSWASMLKLDLSRGVHAGAEYSYRVSDTAVEPKEKEEKKDVETVVRPKWNANREVPLPKSASVTEILERQLRGTASAADRNVVQRMKVAATGTAVHKLMELLKYPSQENMSTLIDRWFPRARERVEKAIRFVQNSSEPALMSIIENGEVEWGFAMMERGLLIEGAVDLWGRAPDGTVWIIDYKTGNPTNRAKAFEQMGLYSLAVRKSGLIKASDRLRLAAVYPFSEEIFIAEEPTAAQIQTQFGF